MKYPEWMEYKTEYYKSGFLELIKLDSDKICIDLIIERWIHLQ